MTDRANLHGIIHKSERKGPLTMGLLWVTMCTLYPCALVGFLWYKEGMSFAQVLLGSFLSCVILLIYALPACHMGAKTGRSYGSVVKSVFGHQGARIVSFNLVWMFIAWYGLISLFCAESLSGLFHFGLPMVVLAPIFASLMALNNFWGFKGVANFARFFAAPLLILWVGYTFFKATLSAPLALYTDPAKISSIASFVMVANFVIGCGVWGNEQDYWRHSKPPVLTIIPPVMIASLVGLCLFPVTGWMVAKISGITDYGQATAFMSNYSFGGVPIFCAVVLIASYFAVNDSNLYGSSNSVSHLFGLNHRVAVCVLALLGAVLASFLSYMGCAKSLEHVASLNCIIMAMPTVILLTEYYVIGPILKRDTICVENAIQSEKKVQYRPAALIALFVGCLVGVLNAGVIPGMESFKFGICSVQGWAAGMIVYILLRLFWKKSHPVADQIAKPPQAVSVAGNAN